MADYWKSQPRKFCQYCKCWIADNKPSVEFHERGKNHKENVAAKISEIKKKSVDKAKQEARMSKEFAAMEEAALKAYEEDLKRLERESAGLPALKPTPPPPQPQARPIVINKTRDQVKKQKKKEKESKKLRARKEAQVWVEGRTGDGHAYYYNNLTGESKWDKPEGFQRANPAPAQPGQTESSAGCPWKEAVSPDGYTYYYNSETGETSWEEPAGFPIEPPGTAPYKGREIQKEPSTTPLEPPPGEEEKPSGAPVAHQAEVPEQESQLSKTPKISFRKRKSEGEPSVKEGEAKVSGASPEGEAEEMKKKEEVQSATAEPEEKKTVEAAPVRKQARKAKSTNPYGRWEKIREEVDPYAKVDLQLPKVEGITVSAPADIPPEPKPKFKERIITSLGGEGGPASFRKNKTQNGKSRSIRQRDDDDD
ncbi:WW domain-binding protein 4 [Spinachia spinachia]